MVIWSKHFQRGYFITPFDARWVLYFATVSSSTVRGWR